jgi:hypothetical protein
MSMRLFNISLLGSDAWTERTVGIAYEMAVKAGGHGSHRPLIPPAYGACGDDKEDTVRNLALIAILLLSAATAACGGDSKSSNEAPASTLPQGSEQVELDPADFTTTIDNPYWPMAPGDRWVYREVDAEGEQKRVEVTVTRNTKTITGIEARVVHDIVTEDGDVVEDTFDWYAQDADGNLWYMGEETKEYENGKVKSTEGSWQAGVDGAQAGIVIPAAPKVGMTYRQEYYAGEAEDEGEILSLSEKATVPSGSFEHVLMTKDSTPLEPKVLEHKFYARGVGPVLAVTVSGGSDREELIRFVRGS